VHIGTAQRHALGQPDMTHLKPVVSCLSLALGHRASMAQHDPLARRIVLIHQENGPAHDGLMPCQPGMAQGQLYTLWHVHLHYFMQVEPDQGQSMKFVISRRYW
jgi:hypothetical protein